MADVPALGAAWNPVTGSVEFGIEPGGASEGVSVQALRDSAGFDVPLGFAPDGSALAVTHWSGEDFTRPGAPAGATDASPAEKLSRLRSGLSPSGSVEDFIGLHAPYCGLAHPAALTEILLYHVLPGRRDSNDVLASTRLRTLQGAFLKQASGTLTDVLERQANIIVVDVPASNGVIHAIDAVVLPFAP